MTTALLQPSTRSQPSLTPTTASSNLQSNVFYTHFSLLRTIEGGFRLPCLNHACDSSTAAITDLFGEP